MPSMICSLLNGMNKVDRRSHSPYLTGPNNLTLKKKNGQVIKHGLSKEKNTHITVKRLKQNIPKY